MEKRKIIHNHSLIVGWYPLRYQTCFSLIKIYAILLFLILVSLFTISAQAGNGQDEKCPLQLDAFEPYKVEKPTDYNHKKYMPQPIERPYPYNDVDREFIPAGFIASIDDFDDDNKDGKREYLAQPNWVAYHLKKTTPTDQITYTAPDPWYKIKEFDTERVYYDSNKSVGDSYREEEDSWTRGYLARPEDLNKLGPKYSCNSYVFANVVPLHKDNNSWSKLEKDIATEVDDDKEGNTQIWVVAGPIYKERKK